MDTGTVLENLRTFDQQMALGTLFGLESPRSETFIPSSSCSVRRLGPRQKQIADFGHL